MTRPSEEILEAGEDGRRWHPGVIWGAIAVVALVVAIVRVNDHQSHPAAEPRPPITASIPPSTPMSDCHVHVCEVSDTPSPAIVSAFADHVPGSIVISEHTVKDLVRGDLVVKRRLVHAVSGNVDMKVAISRAPARSQHAPQSANRIAHHGYLIHFRFIGFYPPARSLLLALADDPRLISVPSVGAVHGPGQPRTDVYRP